MGDAFVVVPPACICGRGKRVARFSTKVCGAKAHVIYDPDLRCPIYHIVTEAKINDIVAAKAMPIEAGATYVYDLGYYDYAWWARLDAADCRIVTRFKKNTPLNVIKSLPITPGTNIISDRIRFCRLVRPKIVEPYAWRHS